MIVMDIEIFRESVLIQLYQMIQKIKDDDDYFKNLVNEPIYYGSQMWIGRDMQSIRMNLKISKEKIKE